MKSKDMIPSAGALDQKRVIELLYRKEEGRTCFASYSGGGWTLEDKITLSDGTRLVPYRPENNLLRHQVVLLPSEPEEYGTTEELFEEIRGYIHRYVDLSPDFETIAASYVLLSWVYDSWNELPYLRVRGDFGSGKSRFLLTVGRIAYKPIFASGASTISPVFRILDAFRGTLVIDESDFRFSDERSEVIKIFNNGNARGFPVLRSESVNNGKEFDPRAYTVFGPKLIATRGNFDDKALESRCLTSDLGIMPLRKDIPLNLSVEHEEEALRLRNNLLLYRFQNGGKVAPVALPRDLPPRLSQVMLPLIAAAPEAARETLVRFANERGRELHEERHERPEYLLLKVLRELQGRGEPIQVRDIARELGEHLGESETSPKWVGFLLRRKLGLFPERRHGSFVLPLSEFSRLPPLLSRYGLDMGDMGDVAAKSSSDLPGVC